LRDRRLILRLHTIFRALIYWAHRAVILAIAWFSCFYKIRSCGQSSSPVDPPHYGNLLDPWLVTHWPIHWPIASSGYLIALDLTIRLVAVLTTTTTCISNNRRSKVVKFGGQLT